MADPSWSKHVADVLRRNDIHFFATVPDYIVSPGAGASLGRSGVHGRHRHREKRKRSASCPAPGWAAGAAPSSCRTAGSATASTRWAL